MALKLFKHGRAACSPVDKQLRRHLDDGPVCQVMDEGLYTGDEAGLLALINEDNLNSALDMPCNEMEILAFLSKEIHAACPKGSHRGLVPEDILGKCKSHFGSKVFSEHDMKYLYNFALMIPASLMRNMAELHFSMVPAAKLRCPPKVFDSIAKIDGGVGRAPFSKVA